MDLIGALKKDPLPKELAFSRAEYDTRVKKVQGMMAEQGLDLHLVSNTPNLGYLTGYDTTMPSGYTVGVVPADGPVWLHCSELEATCALLSSTIEEIALFHWYDAQDTATQLGEVLRDKGCDGKRIGLEMGFPETFASGAFDTRSYLRLKELLPNASFVDTTNLVMEARLIKSPAELDYMRKAGAISYTGLLAAIDAAAEGGTENDVIAAGHAALIGAGSELMSIDPMIMSGARTRYMPHTPYKRTQLKRGDPIYLEFTGTYQRYNAPCMRSAAVGEASDNIKRISDASIKTVELLIENIRPGRTGHEVAQIAKTGLASVPNAYFHGGFGYSIGMGHQPTWTEAPMYVADGIERALEPGMTFHLPMCVWDPLEGGIGFSESVEVTETGCATLTPGTDRTLAIR
jgi:Xaa-Pro aminopeptidase